MKAPRQVRQNFFQMLFLQLRLGMMVICYLNIYVYTVNVLTRVLYLGSFVGSIWRCRVEYFGEELSASNLGKDIANCFFEEYRSDATFFRCLYGVKTNYPKFNYRSKIFFFYKKYNPYNLNVFLIKNFNFI